MIMIGTSIEGSIIGGSQPDFIYNTIKYISGMPFVILFLQKYYFYVHSKSIIDFLEKIAFIDQQYT